MNTLTLNRKKFKFSWLNAVFYTITTVFLLWVLIPFYVVVVTSVTSYAEIYSTLDFVWWPTQGITFTAFKDVLFNDPMAVNGVPSLLRGLFNTLWMTLTTTTVSLFVSSLAAYAYEKLQFPGKEKLFLIQLATMMIPTASMTVPSYIFYETINWTDSILPILIPGMFGSGSAIFFFRAYFTGINNELLEAAKIDGLGVFGSYLRVLIPVAIPAFVAQFIFMFNGGYNSYLGPLLYLQYNDKVITIQLAVSNLQGIFADANQVCAIALLALLPLIIVFLLCQRLFIEGITVGGSKS